VIDVRAAVEEHVAAFNAHDTARLLAGLAPEAVWVTGRDTVTGRAALAELFDDGLWALEPHLDLLSAVVEDSRAAAQLRESITPDGERQSFAIAVFLEFKGGLISRAKVYREGSADL
jgi:ketosteroid isomerase-like protein